MDAKEYIDASIPFLRENDSVDFGLTLFEDFSIESLPVVNSQKKYLGLVSESTLLNSITQGKIKEIAVQKEEAFVLENNHVYEAFGVVDKFDVDIVPVLDLQGDYLGVITSRTLLRNVAKISSAQLSGGIIEFVVGVRDYSMTEISRIVELNGGKIMSSFIFNIDGDIERIRVLLKLNIQDVSSIVSEFRQMNYLITGVYSDHESTDDSEDNLNHFFHYLDI